LNPFLSQEAYQIRKGKDLFKGPSIKGPSSTTIAHFKTKIAYARCNATIDTLPNSLMDSTTSSKVNTMEGEGVGVHSLARNTLGVEGHAEWCTPNSLKDSNVNTSRKQWKKEESGHAP
jgi:hypothetical protein